MSNENQPVSNPPTLHNVTLSGAVEPSPEPQPIVSERAFRFTSFGSTKFLLALATNHTPFQKKKTPLLRFLFCFLLSFRAAH
jgi:hypothetical protein